MLGQKVAVTYTSDLTPQGLARLVEDALELAQLASPTLRGPTRRQPALQAQRSIADLELFDPAVDLASTPPRPCVAPRSPRRAALDLDPRVTNTEGATFTRVSGGSALVTSGGFRGASRGTYASRRGQPGRRRRGRQEAQRLLLDRRAAT